MCLSSPKSIAPPLPPPLPPPEIFSKTALRIGNPKRAGVTKVGGVEQMRGRGVSALRLGDYAGMNTGY